MSKAKNKLWLYALGFLALVGLLAIPFVLTPNAGFGGSDDKGSQVIEQISPGYTPWFTWFWQPPPETSSSCSPFRRRSGRSSSATLSGTPGAVPPQVRMKNNDYH